MDNLSKKISELRAEVDKAAERINLSDLIKERSVLLEQMRAPDFWSDNRRAQELSKKEAGLGRRVEPWLELKKTVVELAELAELNDDSMQPEIELQLQKQDKKLAELKKELRFSGAYDDHDVILSIHAGAGGTDAQDWAQMLLRMYVRWAEAQDLLVSTIDQSPGEEAGIKSATIEITGRSTLRDEPSGSDSMRGSFLYGKLAGEHGVHRLVRLSPFNADNLRQTSFAKVEVLPIIDRPGEIEIDDKDLKIDVYRAGGHGGQSVNTTDSAVRITHIPTGLSVAIQNERSQLQNKETALVILRSRLAQLQLEQHAENLNELKGPNQSAEWGSQIRSYVLHPYKQVKDNRSGYETSDAEKVLDGNLNPVIDAWLEKL